MKRSIRRHQQRVAKFRRVRILRSKWRTAEKPWRDWRLILMAEPGWHTRLFIIRPARIRSKRLERLIEGGRDPENMHWPDYRRPHVYYW